MPRNHRLVSLVFSLVFVLLVTTFSVQAQQSYTYVVQRGDTLAKIAARYGTTWYDIAVANNISNPNRIYAGQVLVIPAHVTYTRPAQSYTIRPGDTLTSIANSFGVTVAQLVETNNLEAGGFYIHAGQVLVIPGTTVTVPLPPPPSPQPPAPQPIPPTSHYYTVQRGDTMFRISRAFSVNVYDLAEANGILNLNRIYTGQRLRIP